MYIHTYIYIHTHIPFLSLASGIHALGFLQACQTLDEDFRDANQETAHVHSNIRMWCVLIVAQVCDIMWSVWCVWDCIVMAHRTMLQSCAWHAHHGRYYMPHATRHTQRNTNDLQGSAWRCSCMSSDCLKVITCITYYTTLCIISPQCCIKPIISTKLCQGCWAFLRGGWKRPAREESARSCACSGGPLRYAQSTY